MESPIGRWWSQAPSKLRASFAMDSLLLPLTKQPRMKSAQVRPHHSACAVTASVRALSFHQKVNTLIQDPSSSDRLPAPDLMLNELLPLN